MGDVKHWRIAFIKQKFVHFGGGEGYLNQLMKACLSDGCDVHLITTKWHDNVWPELKVHEVRRRGLTLGSRAKAFSGAVAEVLSKNDFDISVSLERTAGQDVWRAGEGVHKVWLERRALFQPWYRTLMNEKRFRHRTLLDLESECVQKTPLIIANSEMVKKDIQRVHNKPSECIEVIHNGVDPSKFNLENRRENKNRLRAQMEVGDKAVLLFAGSGFARKGLGELFKVLRALPQCILFVMGRDNPRRWKSLATKYGIERRVRFLPPQENMKPFYHFADITVLPSWFDPFPNVGLESLFSGTPLLTTRYAGVHEVLENEVSGEIIDTPANIDGMASAIKRDMNKGLSPERARAISQSVASYTIANNQKKTLNTLARRFH